MTKEEFQTARELWKTEYAHASFKSAKDGIQTLSERGLEETSPEYYPLSVGVICLYCRPFTNNDLVGMISIKLVPNEFLVLHDQVLTLRNSVFAHSSGTAAVGPDQHMNAVKLKKRHGKIALYMTMVTDIREFFDRLMPLVDALIKKTNRRRSEILTKLQPHIPKTRDGYFRLNIFDQTGPVFIKIEDNSPSA